jgi:excisionase family DNA binding protein
MEKTESESAVQDEVLTPEELAAFLKIGRTHTYALLSSGAIPSFRLGRLRRVRRRDAEAFIDRMVEGENE